MRFRSLTLTAACLAAGVTLAAAQHGRDHHAARAVGQLSCTNASGTITASVYGYTLDVQHSLKIGSQSGGAGAGKVTFSETEMDLDPAAYTQLVTSAAAGAPFARCTFVSADGKLTATFTLVAFDDVKLVGGTAETPQEAHVSRPVTQLTFSYGALRVDNGAGSTGSTPTTGGWNRVQNTGGGL